MGTTPASDGTVTRAPDFLLRLFLAAVVLFLGASGLVYEYVLSTLATHLIGNSIEQFSLIIALMLFAMGVAGFAQRYLVTPHLADLFVFIEIVLGVVGGASALLLYLAFSWMWHFELALYGLAVLIGFLIGTEIPLLMRLNQRWQPELRDNLGQVFSLDYVGALGGALVWAWLLLPLLPLNQIGAILGLINLAVAGATLAAFWGRLHRRWALVATLMGATALLGSLVVWSPDLLDTARQRLFADPIRHELASPYQDIVVTGRGERLSLWLNGHLQLDAEDEFIYHELLAHPAMMAFQRGTGRPPERVLILGGGDGCAAREALRWPSVTDVQVVDLDPAVTKLARSYPPMVALNEGALTGQRVTAPPPAGVAEGPTRDLSRPPADPFQSRGGTTLPLARVHVRHLDADVYLREAAGDASWDVIIADFPDPRTPDLAKLYAVEFYAQIHDHLAPGGVLVTQAGSPWTTRTAYWTIHESLVEAGFAVTPLQANVPTFGPWGWHLARLGPAPDPVGAPPVPTRFLTPATLAAARTLPPPMARPNPPPTPSTRLNPTVMRRYERGEPVRGPYEFPGTTEVR